MHAIEFLKTENDAEWQWLMLESAKTRAQQGPLSFRILLETLAPVAANALRARHPEAAMPTTKDLIAAGRTVPKTRPENWLMTAPLSHLVDAVSETFLVLAMMMRMGMPSPYVTPKEDYWPFGQEGGFCNPMKLKHLN